MVDTSTAVPMAPFVEALKPYIDLAVTTLIGCAVTYAATLFRRWTNIKIDDATLSKITTATQTQAGLAVAKAADNLAGHSIDAHSAQVAQGTLFVANALKAELAASGITPDDVAHMIAAEIGKLQTQAPTVVTPTPGFTLVAPKKE